MIPGAKNHWMNERWMVLASVGILLILALRAVLVPLFVVELASYPLDYLPGESDVLYYVHRLARGQTIYGDSGSLPVLGNLFPPLYPWLAVIGAKIGGASLATLRWMGLIPLLGICAGTAVFVRRAGAGLVLAIGAALLIPCAYHLAAFAVLPRCDAWMTLFLFGAFYFLASPQPTVRATILAGICGALAVFSKQTAVIVLAALHLHLLVQDRRRGLQVLLATLLASAILLVIALWQFGSGFVDSILFLTVRRNLVAGRLFEYWIPGMAPLALLCGLALVRVMVHGSARRWDLLDTYLIGAGLLSCLILSEGSGQNFALPLLPALCMATALSIRELFVAPAGRVPAVAAALAAALSLVLLESPHETTITAPRGRDLEEGRRAAQFLTSSMGPVYTERLWGPIAERVELDNTFVEPIHLRMLAPGRFPREKFEEPFRARRFERLLLYSMEYHYAGFHEMVAKNYQPIRSAVIKQSIGHAPVVYYVRKQDPL
jgi:hypothetical protein